MNLPKAITLICFLFGVSSCEKAYLSPNLVETFELHSSFTGFNYNISILYPATYQQNTAYPTVYLLDGGAYFNEVSEVLDKSIETKVVLISLDYNNENRRASDFTFPEDPTSDDKETGGADKFIQFLNQELIPHLETVIGLKSKERTLYGHSFGGYFCLYSMFQQVAPVPFDNFIAASAPVDFADNYLIQLEQQYFENRDTLEYKLHSSYGSLEANALFLAFTNKIEKHAYATLKYKHEIFENLGHQNTPIKAFENGLKFILE